MEISPLAELGRDDGEAVGVTGRGSVFRYSRGDGVVAFFVIPGLTGNLFFVAVLLGTVRQENGEKHDGRSRFWAFCHCFWHRPAENRSKNCRTVC